MNGRADLIIENGVLTKYGGPGGEVTVPDGVTAIGERAFRGCAALTAVTLPESVTHIGIMAFSGCRALRELRLPESMESISANAFSDCGRLVSAELPRRLGHLGSRAFSDCAALTAVRVPDGVQELLDGTFVGCSSLRTVRLPQGLRKIDNSAFAGCRALEELRLPDGLESIGDQAFYGCAALSRVLLPEGFTFAGDYAFYRCTGLTELRLPESLTDVGIFAFFGCVGLRELRLPPGLARLGEGAFRGCRGLADEKGFLVVRSSLVDYFGPREAAEIPEGVIRIGPEAFPAGSAPLRVSVPESVLSAAPTAFSENSLILRIRRWQPNLARALQDCRVLALITEERALVPKQYRPAMHLGLAFAPDSPPDGPDAEEDLAWLARSAASLRSEAFELPELLHFLCDRKLIRPGSVDAYVSEALARKDPETIALLLDYQAALGQGKLERARREKRRRAEAALEARARRAARSPEEGVDGLRFVLAGPPPGLTTAELRRLLGERGAKLGSAVTASVDRLVSVGAGDEAEKLEKAEELGIPLLPWEDLRRFLGLRDGE